MLTRRQLLASTFAAPLAAAVKKKPNIVFVFSDDHHFQCLGAAGNPHIHTPNLDALASNGVMFTNGIISTSQCCPSRGIMLSGLETYQSGLISNGQTNYQKEVTPVIGQIRAAGYDTIHVGKWHITPTPGKMGFARSPLWLRGGGSVYLNPELRKGQDGKDERVPGHITDLFTDAAIEAVKGAQQPYFLWLTYNAPHTPWLATEKYRAHYQGKSNEEIAPPLHPKGQAKFDWATYYAVITHLDEAVGRLVAALKQNGQWENTVLFFIGDNGYMSGTRNWSGKVRHWEESIRVPYFVSGGYFRGAYRVDDPVASVDATATWLELAGVKPWKPLAGRSLVSYLKTGKGKCTEAYCTWDDPRAEGLAAGVAVEPFRLVRTKQHKLVVFASKKQSLFDVVADPGENNDLAADPKHAALKRRLQAKLQARMKATGDHAISWLG